MDDCFLQCSRLNSKEALLNTLMYFTSQQKGAQIEVLWMGRGGGSIPYEGNLTTTPTDRDSQVNGEHQFLPFPFVIFISTSAQVKQTLLPMSSDEDMLIS